jgi:flagellar protein FliS
MLYDIVIADLRKAIKNLNAGDIEGRTSALVRCLNALEALQGTLQMETGGEAAQHLYRFYSLARAKILEGQIKCNARLFEEIVQSMLQVRALWEDVKQQCELPATPEPWKVLAGDEPSASGAWSA